MMKVIQTILLQLTNTMLNIILRESGFIITSVIFQYKPTKEINHLVDTSIIVGVKHMDP